MSRLIEKLTTASTVVLLGSAVVLLSVPGGRLREPFDAWREARRDRARILEHWSEATSRPRFGRQDGTVDLIEFADYECPACRGVNAAVDSMIEAEPHTTIAYVNVPITSHLHAMGAAIAAVCADRQGRFEAYHRQLFATSEWLVDDNWLREAIRSGVPDTAAFHRCLRDASTAATVQADLKLASKLSISATPTFLSMAGRYVGDSPAHELVLFLRRGF